jgi:DNA-binding response OmpR family regulator
MAKKLLLVDDDVTLSEMYSERLKASGFEVTVAHDGEAGLAEAKNGYDLVLLDIMMPKMNGLDVLKAIKADSKVKDTPVLMLTALIQDLDKSKGITAGAVDYFVKSEVMPGDLVKRVKEILGEEK